MMPRHRFMSCAFLALGLLVTRPCAAAPTTAPMVYKAVLSGGYVYLLDHHKRLISAHVLGGAARVNDLPLWEWPDAAPPLGFEWDVSEEALFLLRPFEEAAAQYNVELLRIPLALVATPAPRTTTAIVDPLPGLQFSIGTAYPLNNAVGAATVSSGRVHCDITGAGGKVVVRVAVDLRTLIAKGHVQLWESGKRWTALREYDDQGLSAGPFVLVEGAHPPRTVPPAATQPSTHDAQVLHFPSPSAIQERTAGNAIILLVDKSQPASSALEFVATRGAIRFIEREGEVRADDPHVKQVEHALAQAWKEFRPALPR